MAVTELPSQIGLAAAASYLIQWMKNSPKFSWVTQHTSGLNRWLGIAASGLAGIGIHYTYTHTDEGVYVITLTGLTMASIYHYAATWFTQWAFQQAYFKAVVAQASTVPTKSIEGMGAAVVAVPPSAAGAVPAEEKKP